MYSIDNEFLNFKILTKFCKNLIYNIILPKYSNKQYNTLIINILNKNNFKIIIYIVSSTKNLNKPYKLMIINDLNNYYY